MRCIEPCNLFVTGATRCGAGVSPLVLGGLLPDQGIAFVADTVDARQRLARERQLLQLLADRVHFEVPRIEWVETHGN
jgi:hypothetical protein